MRLAAIASALAIVLCVAVFGAILQKASLPVPAPAPPQATPTEDRAPGSADNADERSPTPAAQASPMPAAMPTSCSNPNALGGFARGRNRHHRRARLRIRAFQEP